MFRNLQKWLDGKARQAKQDDIDELIEVLKTTEHEIRHLQNRGDVIRARIAQLRRELAEPPHLVGEVNS